uniref:EOG090X0GJG n=1 Tax=Moina brachiata TaxID=675436 RepID=A0A4Y7NJI8_9CRUS|nr:EOG090X0GJG [Moina brachiata]SVE93332.1 EOG090X0GJG [Moina brachiata]
MKSAEELQQQLYYLLEQLQEMARKLPLQYQQRMPYELLSGLANCLLNETIFKIVEGLTEIQQVTEKQLLQQRLQLLQRQKAEKEAVAKKPDSESERDLLIAKQTEELKEADMNLIKQLDQLVLDQQSALEKAGVPGFYSTTNTQEIQERVWGVAYQIASDDVEYVSKYLDHREKDGYRRTETTFHPKCSQTGQILAPFGLEFYLATSDNPFYVGHESLETIARHIVSSSGPSGTNREYLYQLARALREMLGDDAMALHHDSSDRHLFELEKRVLALEDTLH